MVKRGWIPLETAIQVSGWPAAAISHALELAVVDRRIRRGQWMLSEADLAVLVLARQTGELIGHRPELRMVSLWRSAVEAAGGDGVLVVQGPLVAGAGPAKLDIALWSGRPLLAVSLGDLMHSVRAACRAAAQRPR